MHRLITVFAAMLSVAAWAIDPPRPQSPPPAPPPAGQKSEIPDAPAEQARRPEPAPADDEESLPPLPADAAPAGPPPARFNPTEKVRADFPVSFPVDI